MLLPLLFHFPVMEHIKVSPDQIRTNKIFYKLGALESLQFSTQLRRRLAFRNSLHIDFLTLVV